jgi:hypothetical protein
VLSYHGSLAALDHLSRQHDALRPVIERNGRPGRLHRAFFDWTDAVLYQMRLKPWRLGMLELRIIGLEKLLRRAIEYLD